MKHLQTYRGFESQHALNEGDEYRKMNMDYILNKFVRVPNNEKLYHPSEADFADLPWYQALKAAFPGFKLERVRKKGDSYSWFFSGPSSGKTPIIYEVNREGDKNSHTESKTRIAVGTSFLILPQVVTILLNDKESWNQVFKMLYFAQFSRPEWSGLKHILELFSEDLKEFYKTGNLGIVGVKKNCNPYGGHYKSEVNMLKNLPYGIFDDLKAGFAKKMEEDPAEIQYAISQCQLPKGTAETGFGTNRLYPENEVLNFYNLMKDEGYVPPAGFDEETGEISGLHKSLGDIGL